MKICDTNAILLKYFDSGEADRILVFFTLDFGVVKLIAKSARKSAKRQFSTIDLLTYMQISFKPVERRNLQQLSDIKMIDPFLNIREEINTLSVALYFTQLIDKFYKEHEKDEKMFYLLLSFLERFDRGDFQLLDIVLFQLRLLEGAGFSPNFTTCLDCEKELETMSDKSFYFDIERGGSVCKACGFERTRHRISLRTMQFLSAAQHYSMESSTNISVTPRTIKDSAAMLSSFIVYHLGQRVSSYEYLQKLGIVS